MTPARLIEWRESRGLSKAAACRLLGVGSTNTWRMYESGKPIPAYIAYAIAAIQFGLPPYQ